MRPRLHYHSDCLFFAGSENMLANFFTSPDIHELFDLSFSYRQTYLYDEGLRKRVAQLPPLFPLNLWDYPEWAKYIRQKFPSLFATLILALLNIVGIKFWIILRNTLLIAWTLRKEKIDLVHVNNGGFPGAYSCYSMVFAAKLLRVPHVIFVINNQAVPYERFSRQLERPLDFVLKKLVSLFVTGSKNSAQKLKNVLHLPYEKFSSIANGISPREPSVLAPAYLQAERLSLAPGQIIFGTVALFEKRKGHHILLQAIKILREKNALNPLPLFVWEGDGPELSRLKAAVKENDLGKNIIFLPHQKNIFDFLNALDVLVLPSTHNEDFPNIILEAMSLSKPVISTIMAGIPEQVSHGETGLLAAPGNPYELAEAIEILAKNVSLRTNMAKAGKVKFEENFKSSISVARYRKLYLDFIHKGRAP